MRSSNEDWDNYDECEDCPIIYKNFWTNKKRKISALKLQKDYEKKFPHLILLDKYEISKEFPVGIDSSQIIDGTAYVVAAGYALQRGARCVYINHTEECKEDQAYTIKMLKKHKRFQEELLDKISK